MSIKPIQSRIFFPYLHLMNRLTILLLLVVAMLFSCKKENDNPQWDVNLLGPLAHASLGIENLIGDSLIEADANGAIRLLIDTSYSNFKLDSIYEIPDTSISTVVIFPPFPQTIQPNTPFLSNNNNVNLGVSGVQLKLADLQNGSILIEMKNTLRSKIYYTYTIPKAKKNGVPFSVTFTVDSASTTDPKFFSGNYDFTGYTIDLTGSTGGLYNTIAYSVEARANPTGVEFNLFGSDTLINVKTSFLGITPKYVRGYLGQADLSDNKSLNLGIRSLISNGTILLDSIEMKFEVVNYIGADIQAYVNQMFSVNNQNGTTIQLNSPTLIQHYLNINRAAEDAPVSYNVHPSYYSAVLNNSNSNIKQIIESLPDSLKYDLSLNLNPLGNISGSTDFIYSDKIVDTRIQVSMPLAFAANQLTLSQTIDFSIQNSTDLDPIGPSEITIYADNGFPFDMDIQLSLLDETGSTIDNLLVPGLIGSAQTNINNLVSASTLTKLKVPTTESRKEKLKATKQIRIRAAFTTPNYPQLFQLYNTYHLDLKLIGDGEYHIR